MLRTAEAAHHRRPGAAGPGRGTGRRTAVAEALGGQPGRDRLCLALRGRVARADGQRAVRRPRVGLKRVHRLVSEQVIAVPRRRVERALSKVDVLPDRERVRLHLVGHRGRARADVHPDRVERGAQPRLEAAAGLGRDRRATTRDPQPIGESGRHTTTARFGAAAHQSAYRPVASQPHPVRNAGPGGRTPIPLDVFGARRLSFPGTDAFDHASISPTPQDQDNAAELYNGSARESEASRR
nr:hypothetical protein GCM10020092_082750 [Actinoplanes digitatis]